MSQPSKPCPFDWTDGKNDKLEGGQLLAVREHRFAYGFFDENGELTNAFIANVAHGENIPALWSAYPDELADLILVVLDHMGEWEGYNVYANEGAPAGMTVGEHAHLHVKRRKVGEPSSGMGLGMLIKKYNELASAYEELEKKYKALLAVHDVYVSRYGHEVEPWRSVT